MHRIQNKIREIPGWGIDSCSPQEKEGMERAATERKQQNHWERPQQQIQMVEVLKSMERPALPTVFGQESPPWGMNGALRRYAFEFSESRYRHWLLLLASDRIGSLEKLANEALNGKFPNLLKEYGAAALWKHDKKRFLAGTIIRIAALSVAIAVIRQLIRRK